MFAELRVCHIFKYLRYKSSHLLCLPHPTPSLRNPQSPSEESFAVILPEAAWAEQGEARFGPSCLESQNLETGDGVYW